MPRHWFLTRHSNPYIYVPNLIGGLHGARPRVDVPSYYEVVSDPSTTDKVYTMLYQDTSG